MKKLVSTKSLEKQARELRKMIIKRASEDSGHCASPLGTVELTQALLHVFDFTKDKIVFDVGHQAHAYKILTGRKNKFFTMSKKGGIAAYPDIHESPYDFYGVGHSSTATSAALGIAFDHQEYKTIAVVGDGALTGGETFEALNHAGQAQPNLLVIYNDNGMTLTKTVGKLTDKEKIKEFSQSLGFEYRGIFDGHDTALLIKELNDIKNLKRPVFMHIKTIKGKGYGPAEKNPSRFHWPAPFDIKTGSPKNPAQGDNFFKHNHKKGREYLKKYKNVYFVTPAFINWGLKDIAKRFPNKVVDTGISEQHCVTFSSALALNNNKVLCYISSNFLPRAFDQLIDVCLQNIPMVFVITFPGISPDGPTHQGIYTFPMLNMLPNSTIFHPCGLKEYDRLLDLAIKTKGPAFVQIPEENITVKKSSADIIEMKSGTKLTILPLGNLMGKAINVAEKLKGIEILYLPMLKPANLDLLTKHLQRTKKLLILEDGFIKSGIGEDLAYRLNARIKDLKYKILGVPDKFPIQGSLDEVYKECGLGEENILNEARKLLVMA